MSIHSNHGVPASREEAAKSLREMKEFHAREDAKREAERERARLAAIEQEKRWAEIYAAMGMDETIEIPGKQGGKEIVLRYVVEKNGRLRAV